MMSRLLLRNIKQIKRSLVFLKLFHLFNQGLCAESHKNSFPFLICKYNYKKFED